MHPGFRTVLEGAKRRNVVAPPVRAERVKTPTRAPKARYSGVKPDCEPVTYPSMYVPALRASRVYLTLRARSRAGLFHFAASRLRKPWLHLLFKDHQSPDSVD